MLSFGPIWEATNLILLDSSRANSKIFTESHLRELGAAEELSVADLLTMVQPGKSPWFSSGKAKQSKNKNKNKIDAIADSMG